MTGSVNRGILTLLLSADLADDVDQVSSLEVQLVGLISHAVPQALVVVGVIR